LKQQSKTLCAFAFKQYLFALALDVCKWSVAGGTSKQSNV